MEAEIKKLDSTKATYTSGILTEILPQTSDIFSPFILNVINESIMSNIFSHILKLANITSAYKKDSEYDKSNYGPVSVCQIYHRFLKVSFTIKYLNAYQNTFSQYQTVSIFEKVLMHKSVY